jgi:hypothetical protein
MTTLLRLLRSLGPAGAVANAAALLDERRHEDRVVESVARKLEPADRLRLAA